jgi:hypothetical protein
LFCSAEFIVVSQRGADTGIKRRSTVPSVS